MFALAQQRSDNLDKRSQCINQASCAGFFMHRHRFPEGHRPAYIRGMCVANIVVSFRLFGRTVASICLLGV